MRYILTFTVIAIVLCCSCGGAPSAPATITSAAQQGQGTPSISINPSSAIVPLGGVKQFVATVQGIANTTVLWSIQEGGVGGSIDPTGKYTAPMTAGTYHVIAQSQADLSLTAVATITVPSGEAQGVYAGTYSYGISFYAIVLPNDMFYSIDGITLADGSMVQIWSERTGQGRSSSGTYTAELTPFTSDRSFSSSLSATYVPGASMTGFLTLGDRIWHTFTAAALPASSLNFDTPADLSQVVGTWKAWVLCDVLVGGSEGECEPFTANIGADGELTVPGSCVRGTLTPSPSNKNFFDVKVTPGPGYCPGTGKTGTGIAVNMLLPDGTTQQLLLAGVLDGHSVVLVAQR